MRTFRLAVLGVVLAGGCAGSIVRSERGGDGPGLPYSLPRSVLEFTVTVAKTQNDGQADVSDYSISIEATKHTVADPENTFTLRHCLNDAASDDLKIVLNSNGLLGSVTVESSEQSLNILKDLLTTASNVFRLASTGGFAALETLDDKGGLREEAMAVIGAELDARLGRVLGTHKVYWILPSNPAWMDNSISKILQPIPGDSDWVLHASLRRVPRVRQQTSDGEADREVRDSQRRADFAAADGVLTRGIAPYVVECRLDWEWSKKIPDERTKMTLEDVKTEKEKQLHEATLDRRRKKLSVDLAENEGNQDGQVQLKAKLALEEALFEEELAEAAMSSDRLKDTQETEQRRLTMVYKAAALELGVEFDGSSSTLGHSRCVAAVRMLANMPDYSDIFVLPMGRAMFVKTKYMASFSDGTLARFDTNRPSPIAAFAAFPVEFTERLLKIPSEIIKLKIDLATDTTTLLDKEASLRQAEKRHEAVVVTGEQETISAHLAADNAYFDALKDAHLARLAWDEALGSGASDEPLKRIAYLRAANAANAKAELAGREFPYVPEDLPEVP